jgi:hypothetical protein
VVEQSWASSSRSQSALATPIVIPQAVWLAASAESAISTRSAAEEVEDEIRDMKAR